MLELVQLGPHCTSRHLQKLVHYIYVARTFHKVGGWYLTEVPCIITARKRSLGQGNVFTPVCYSVHRGCVHPSRADTPPLGRQHPEPTPPGETPLPIR